MQKRVVRHIDHEPEYHQRRERAVVAVFGEDPITQRSERMMRIGRGGFLYVKKRVIIPGVSIDEIPDLCGTFHRAEKRGMIRVGNMAANRFAIALVAMVGVHGRRKSG